MAVMKSENSRKPRRDRLPVVSQCIVDNRWLVFIVVKIYKWFGLSSAWGWTRKRCAGT